jgi:hypothetical protein
MGAINGQNISDFYANATQRGFARDFQFRITAFNVNGISLGPDDLVFLKTANLPGKSISTVQAPFMGLDFQIPGTVKFENAAWAVKFYCTQDYRLRDLLERSMRGTFDEEESAGNLEPRGLDDNIITLTLIDDNLNPIRDYTLRGAFLVKLDETGYDLTKNGGIQEVGAAVAYQYWTVGPAGVSLGRKNAFGSLIGNLAGNILGNVANKVANKAINSLTKKLFGG